MAKSFVVVETSMDSSDNSLLQENSDAGSGDEEQNVTPGNFAWADAMSKVLNTSVQEKNFILAKAKKDSEIKEKKEEEVEIVDSSGRILNKPENPKGKRNLNSKRKEMLEKQKEKALWEAMCHVKPDVTKKDKERELMRIATRGVVHLFNTVENHQKTFKNNKNKDSKKKTKLNIIKGNFMDILKGHSKESVKPQDDPVVKKVKKEETWSILKDDFMMGAEMKDWDKESDNDK